MGRKKEFRQLTKQHTDSVAAKTPLHGLIQLVKHHCEISWPEAGILGRLLFQFFSARQEHRPEGQIVFPARWTPGRSGRKSASLREPVMVRLTVFHPHDVELWREFGIKAMEQARIIRMVGEAIAQGAILALEDISLLTISAAKTVRETLKPLWEQGVRLPLRGMNKCFSDGMHCTQDQLALKRFLAGESIEVLRQSLYISKSAWSDLLQELQAQINQQQGELWDVWEETPDDVREAVGMTWNIAEDATSRTEEVLPEERLHERLTSYFGMSPAGADLLLEKVKEWFSAGSDARRQAEQVLYYAVADYEPAGKPLAECDLVPVTLDYVTEQDRQGFSQDAPKHLFEERLQRFAKQAFEQGGVLNQSDLGFLLGASCDAIQYADRNSDALLPTRGNVVDIGPGLTHAKKIIQLHMEGYSESDIVKRTHHTYVSVENYIDTFCKIVGLSEEGLTAVEIRMALGCSLSSVKGYLALKEQFDTNEYRWTMAQVRNRYAQKKRCYCRQGGTKTNDSKGL